MITGEIVNTALGPVEVEVQGTGTPVLSIHGTPGGIDAARLQARFLPLDTFRTICLSRPGYMGTPLDLKDTSFDHEADLLAALLDALNIERAAVLAWSGGGAVTYRLAVRHPDRITSIVAVAAVSKRIVLPKFDLASKFLFKTRLGERTLETLAKHRPEHLVEGALASEGDLKGEALKKATQQVMADPEQRSLVLEIAPMLNIAGNRRAGWYNDEYNFANMEDLELEKVECPVLLVHGEVDTDCPPEHSQYANEHLPHSKLVVLEQGTHFAMYAHPDGRTVMEEAKRWLAGQM